MQIRDLAEVVFHFMIEDYFFKHELKFFYDKPLNYFVGSYKHLSCLCYSMFSLFFLNNNKYKPPLHVYIIKKL